MRGTTIALLALWSVAGCSNAPEAKGPEHNEAAQDITQQFGDAVLAGKYDEAHSLLTTEAQKTFTAEWIKREYEAKVGEIRQGTPTFKADRVEAGFGSLPDDEKEMKETYGVPNAPPKDTWIAWASADIGASESTSSGPEIVQGISTRLLVVKDGGRPKIAHVEFEFMD